MKGGGNTVIYIFEQPDRLDLEAAMHLLPADRAEKVKRFRFDKDKKRSAAAWFLLRFALRREYGIAEPGEFTFGEHGKPFLTGHPEVFFSLSHCREAVVCALSDSEVGADAQEFSEPSPGMEKRIFSPAEAEAMKAAEDKTLFFTTVWTGKEAELKRRGTGITESLRETDILALENLAVFPREGYVISVSGSGANEAKTVEVGIEELTE